MNFNEAEARVPRITDFKDLIKFMILGFQIASLKHDLGF